MNCQIAQYLISTMLLSAWVSPASCSQCPESSPGVVKVLPATPTISREVMDTPCRIVKDGNIIRLSNGFLTTEVSADTGTVTAVINKITGQRTPVQNDQVGFECARQGNTDLAWMCASDKKHAFETIVADDDKGSSLVLTEQLQGMAVSISYKIERGRFWVERKLIVSGDKNEITFNKLIYGRLAVPEAQVRTLKLGKFDSPRLVSSGKGGLFAGVGWWFYSVSDEGLYQNTDMKYAIRGDYESEPWYIGIFREEDSEPYPGWLWYADFLRLRKSDWDRQSSYSYWNAGWGQWGIDIDDQSAAAYIDLARRLGIRCILFGGGGMGKGIDDYARLVDTDNTTRRNLALLKMYGMTAGFLYSGLLSEKWADRKLIDTNLEVLAKISRSGYGSSHFDFFSSVDTYNAHRNVTDYFRAARKNMQYTECHLGMADYGPQFQREVLINHPNDLHGFDISRFSSDWATFLGFRYSRSEWQRKYDYLMPEYGLYYYITHYSNWGHPRRYTDPESQQFLYGPHAYAGIAYNFHDVIGFRDSLIATTGFSPYLVFGHLDLRMPERDVDFAKSCKQWVSDNVDVLRRGRICIENNDVCVISKLANGKGLIYVLNYSSGAKEFSLKLEAELTKPVKIRLIYPNVENLALKGDGRLVNIRVKGESVAILDVNESVNSLPPQNPSRFPIDLTKWQKNPDGWCGSFALPGMRKKLEHPVNCISIPNKLLSQDEMQDSNPSLLDMVKPSPDSNPITVISYLGRGKLPNRFKEVYGFGDDGTAETWKFVPWAFTDRIWLAYRPDTPTLLRDSLPKAKFNGTEVVFIPRVDYRPGESETWTCPLFYADITSICNYDGKNVVTMLGLDGAKPPVCYVVSAIDRY